MLYSRGFGAGWYTWHPQHRGLVFDREIVEAAAEIARRKYGEDVYTGGRRRWAARSPSKINRDMSEKWTMSADGQSATVTGRERVPLWKKLLPVWWLLNDSEQTVDQAPWYHPEWPRWRRWLVWNVFRNPCQNLRAYVLGVQDRNYTVTGRAPVTAVQRDDLAETGWQWCVIWLALPRPFVSYSGTRATWYLGWQPSGIFGAKLVFH